MKRIFKYELEVKDNQTLEMASSNILSVKEQNEKVVVYALVDTESPSVKYEFSMNGTGNPITFDIETFKFLGTVKMHNGSLMYHVFYKKV